MTLITECICKHCGVTFVLVGLKPKKNEQKNVCGGCQNRIQKDKAGEVVKDYTQAKNLNPESSACANCVFFKKTKRGIFWAPCAKGKVSDQQDTADPDLPGLVYYLDVCGDFNHGL